MINVKQENGLWTMEIQEKFVYEKLKDLEADFGVIADMKSNKGNYFQKMKEQKITNFNKEIDTMIEKLKTMKEETPK